MKREKIVTALFVMCFAFFTTGCNDIIKPPNVHEQARETGTILVSINGHGTGKTIMPSMVLDDFGKFKLNFAAQTDGNSNFDLTWDDGSGTVDLAVGVWELTVTAYLAGELSGEPVLHEAAKSNAEIIDVPSGEIVPVHIMLLPIEEGSGIFCWNIGFDGDFDSAVMEIWRVDTCTLLDDKTVTLIENSITQTTNMDSQVSLDAGEYRVIFALKNGQEETAVSEILHIYKNMESSFTETFTTKKIPVELLKYIFDAWDATEKEWKLDEAGIMAGHFTHLGINGVDDTHFDGIIAWLNTLCVTGLVPDGLEELKILVDAALIGLASKDADFLDAENYEFRFDAEQAIAGLVKNGTGIDGFAWTGNDTVTVSIGAYAVDFEFSDDIIFPTPNLVFTLINNNTAYSVSRGTASDTNVIIPSIYNDLPVIAIADSGFQNFSEMVSIIIPNSVTSIGSLAFRYCTGLISISIPPSVTSIGNNAFSGCTSLKSIYVENNNPNFISHNGKLYNRLKTEIIRVPPQAIKGIFTIESNVVNIASGAFSGCTGMTDITIPESVINIGSGAFSSCTGLLNITISNNITSIGNNTFTGCTSLSSITIPASVTSIGNLAFFNCTGLTNITLPAVSQTFVSMFSGATNVPASLKTVVINGGNSIPANSFSGCTNLTDITINNSVTSIGAYAFLNCSALMTITLPAVSQTFTSMFNGATNVPASLKTVVINGGNSIPDNSFNDCRNLTNIIINNSVKSIGNNAFYRCNGLTSISIPESVINIGDYAFALCNGLTSFMFGNNVTTIGNNSFQSCTNLTAITIPESVTSIGNSAFVACTGLTSLTIPNNVTNIGDETFRGCTELISIAIGNSVMSIGSSAFRGCTNLMNITMSNSVKNISNYAFMDCTSLMNITIPASVTSIGSGVFLNCTGLTSITLPAVNQTFVSIFNGAAGVPASLKNVVINGGNSTITANSFSNCNGLTSVTIGNGITNTGTETFSGCTSLKNVTIGNSVTIIAYGAFQGCTGLTDITISNSVTLLHSYSFSGCSNLTSITIPVSVNTVNSYAFQNCTSLTTVYYAGEDSSNWSAINIAANNTSLTSATHYYYSETQPVGSGNFWHFVDEVPTIWE